MPINPDQYADLIAHLARRIMNRHGDTLVRAYVNPPILTAEVVRDRLEADLRVVLRAALYDFVSEAAMPDVQEILERLVR